MSRMTPTARSLAYARGQGWIAGVTERWNPHARIRQDLFGFIDLIVIDPEGAIIAVQATSASNHASRREKILDIPAAVHWALAGGLIEVWSWGKKGPRGGRKVWTLRRERVEP